MLEPLSHPLQGALPGAFRLGYPLLRGRWDEMVAENGALRPHWEGFIEFLSSLPAPEMGRRWDLGLKLIRENGVTYNVYGDPRGLDRLWQLDPLPMMLSAEEWRGIEAALIQRANLLNRILADLYGAQELMAQGLLPPAMIFAHPGYLRPLRHAPAAGGVHLHLYAADIARRPDGAWQVMADRCEAPTGMGYALENRAIITRTLTDGLRSQPVQPVTPFLQQWRDSLMNLSPRRREAPRIVLLTPGPYNEAYFEHAYLARHLGVTLVESEDLTMRDGQVWLKTLDGLQPIDVILRRTSGPYCDPLELRSDSMLGVAGLAQALRAGTVAMANALGSGVIEGGGLAPFLPALAKRLLGEDLSMPSAETWWCGRRQDRDHVLANLDRLVVKPVPPGGGTPWFGDELTAAQRAELAEQIAGHPHEFIAQERVRLSTVPVWTKGALDPRPMMLRVFLAAHEGDYVAMPGGLTRVAAQRAGSLVSTQQGGGSKDTWVLANRSERSAAVVRTGAPRVKLLRSSRDLPSRVADNMFWFGRYLERGEDSARLLRATLSRVGAMAGLGALDELPVALQLLRRRFRAPPGLSDDAWIATIPGMAFDSACVDSPAFTVERVHRMASLARDRLSPDTWRAVNNQLEVVRPTASGPALLPEEALSALNALVLASEALSGLVMENMTRGLSWRFVDIGRRLERGIHATELIAGVLARPGGVTEAALDVMLEVSDSSITYRSRYLSTPQFAPVLDLLIADESNPRSLGFQVAALAAHMDVLAAHRQAAFLRPEQRLMVWLSGAVRTADIEVLAAPDEDGDRHNLAGFLEVLRSKLWELSEVVTREYFTHAAHDQPGSRASGEAWL